jgi:YVTN family beta-propeller protein
LVIATGACSLTSCGSDPNEPRRVPASIVILPNAPSLVQNTSKQLTATVVDAAGREIEGEVVTYESSATTILTVSETGLLVSVGPVGTATITVRDGELSGTVIAMVTLAPNTITVTPNPVAIRTGSSLQLSIIVTDANGQPILSPPLTVTSSNPQLVSVTEWGYVTSGVGSGSATLLVQSGGLSLTVPVSVAQVPTSLQLAPTFLVVGAGEAQSLTATVLDAAGGPIPGAPVTFTSSDPSIVTVSSTGLVTSVGPEGTATVTATIGTLTATASIFVGEAPAGTVVASVPLLTQPWGAAVTSNGDFFVTTVEGTVARGTFPTYAFPTTIPVGSQALSVTVNAAGTFAYVAQGQDEGGTPGIAIIDLATNVVTDVIPIMNKGISWCVALSKDEQTLFVGTEAGLVAVDVATRTVVNDHVADGGVNAISRAPGSDLLYASVGGSVVVEVDGTTRAVRRTLAVNGGSLQETAASLDGTELYIADESGGLVIWDLETNQLKETIVEAQAGFGLALSPNGKFIYVASTLGTSITIVDRVTRTVLRTLTPGGAPRRIAFNPVTGVALVTNAGGWVDFVN